MVSVLFVSATGLLPLIDNGSATAATVTSRSLTLGSAQTSIVTTYDFSFVPATVPSPIQGLKFQACTTAIGTCTAPSGLSFSSTAGGTLTGTWTVSGTNFAVDATGANDCTASASILCAKRTAASNETGSSVRGVHFTTITNPNGSSCATVNCTFFVRMSVYNNNTFTATSGGLVDNGTVAASTTQTLTVNATIQESLIFCVGATTIDDSNTSTPPSCSGVSGTSISLGPLSSSNVSVSPVSVANGGDANNGIAQLSTNATNGAAVTYDAIQQSGTNHLGTLRVAGVSCNSGTVNTDQCVNAIGTTKATITAGTEAFGMTVAGINCNNSPATAYPCSYTGNTYNLRKNTNYDGTGSATTYDSDANLVSGTTSGSYAWDESGSAATIASSTTVLDRESLILKFAASPTVVTPTGTYTAKADFIATPTY
ncbi:MAG TPA: hypothetical protein VLG27_02180 [Candidatus Saccharimonadia bacterium]|nr:hypothetical protein [Candidatus Saccharimonadia bacterium]